MAKMFYESYNLGAPKLAIVRAANKIVEEYAEKGYDLTLRQLYYQFVSRDLFPDSWKDPATGSTNNIKSYKKLQSIINHARLTGLVDWERIVDRTRYVRHVSTWENPQSILASCVASFKTDKWRNQLYRPEVWIEKDALIGVIEPVCHDLELPFLACRGYTSASELWSSARRAFEQLKAGKRPVILHLGDHDPSGVDMTRDIEDRFKTFIDMDWMREVMKPKPGTKMTLKTIRDDIERVSGARGVLMKRIALNRDQVDLYDPPPNPAKTTDARFKNYKEEHGEDCWELDALEPTVIGDLIRTELEGLLDGDQWQKDVELQEAMRSELKDVKDNWPKSVRWARTDIPDVAEKIGSWVDEYVDRNNLEPNARLREAGSDDMPREELTDRIEGYLSTGQEPKG